MKVSILLAAAMIGGCSLVSPATPTAVPQPIRNPTVEEAQVVASFLLVDQGKTLRIGSDEILSEAAKEDTRVFILRFKVLPIEGLGGLIRREDSLLLQRREGGNSVAVTVGSWYGTRCVFTASGETSVAAISGIVFAVTEKGAALNAATTAYEELSLGSGITSFKPSWEATSRDDRAIRIPGRVFVPPA